MEPLPTSYYCLPDWLETPKEYCRGLRKVIAKRSAAKRKKLWAAAREKQTRRELEKILPNAAALLGPSARKI